MSGLMTYLWVSGLSLWAVVIAHQAVRGSTWFGMNRILLIIGSVAAMLLPIYEWTMVEMLAMPEATLPVVELIAIGGSEAGTDLLQWALIIWAAGAAFMFLRFVVGLCGIMRVVRRARNQPDGTRLSDIDSPFSFFGHVVVPSSLTGAERDLVVAHERVHVGRLHSLDRLLFEVLRCIQWFNPAAHLLCRYVAEVHEFEADSVADAASNGADYAGLILSQTVLSQVGSAPVNAFFNHSLTKSRIIMLNRRRTPAHGLVRHFAVVPAVAAMLWLNACADGGSATDLALNTQETAVEQAEKMPEYPGGMTELANFLGTVIKYPEGAKADSVQGQVFVSFCIATDGKVTDVAVAKGVREDLDAEAVRAVSTMPNWIPGSDTGQPVKVKLTLPISFRLD